MSREQRTPAQPVLDFGSGARAQVALRKSATFFRRNPAAAFSLGFLVFMAVVSTVLAPVIATHDPKVVDFPDKLQGPSPRHFFGTDQAGRDLFSRAVYGGRFSLIVGFSVASIATAAAIVVGLISAWFSLADKIIMRVVDGMLAIPGLLLAIAFLTIFGHTVLILIGVLALGGVAGGSRVARSSVLSLKNQVYVEAARAVGAPTWRIMARHVIPNMLAPMMVFGTVLVPGAILGEASLAFLGAGIDPGTPTWGNMMGEARAWMSRHSWMMFWPGIAITLTVLAFSVGGDVLRDVMDPRLRGSEHA